MAALVLAGVNHTTAGVELREKLVFTGDALPAGLRRLARVAREGVILSTCNRSEVYAVLDDGVDAEELLRGFIADECGVLERDLAGALYVHHGADAARHLLRVAAGLDSMLLGEEQILGQVRAALAAAQVAGAAGPLLSRLWMQALRTGKRARARTDIARGRVSVAHAGIDLAAEALGGLTGRRALVIGAGQMATLAARVLRNRRVAELVVANRSGERGEALARDTGGRYAPLDHLAAELAGVDLVVAAVAVPGPVLRRADLERAVAGRRPPLVVVDLCVPRAIDPAAGAHPRVQLYGVDEIGARAAVNRARAGADARQAERYVAAGLDAFLAWWRGRAAAGTLAAVQRHAEDLRSAELDRALRRLGHLSERDRAVVAGLSRAIVDELLREPVRRLTDPLTARAASVAVEQIFGLECSPANAAPQGARFRAVSPPQWEDLAGPGPVDDTLAAVQAANG